MKPSATLWWTALVFAVIFSPGLRAQPKESVAGPSGRDPMAAAAAIDREVEKLLGQEKVAISPQADDAEFLRRLYLDLTGRIPTAQQAAAFLDSQDPDQRRRLIDELLARPEYGQHFSRLWQLLIAPQQNEVFFRTVLGRTGLEGFDRWLADGFNQGRGWHLMVRDMLTAEGDPQRNPATVFTLSNMEKARVQPDLLAVSTGRLFLGVRLQCVECHDHFYAEWKQTDFWGLAAFFGQVRYVSERPGVGAVSESASDLRRPKAPPVKGAAIVIPASGGNKGAGKVVRAKFLLGSEPKLPDTGPYRPALADWVAGSDNPYLAPAAANRLWGHFFGRGLVHPVDDMFGGRTPSHPELLELLAREFRAGGHDFKHLIRCICNSRAYQRSSRPLPENAEDHRLYSHMSVKVMTPDVLYDSLTTALGVPQLKIEAADSVRMLLPPAELARFRFTRFFQTRDADANEYTQGIPHALGLLNSETLNGVSPTAQRLASLPAAQAIESLYLTALARRPTPDETRVMSDYLARRKDRDGAKGYAAVLWILLNTSEFVLNH